MVCLHGFTDTWRTWELVLPALEREHDVLAPTLTGHAGGPPIAGEVTDAMLADGVERAMDEAGFDTAHIVGNSLGGFVSLQLAARGRATSVARALARGRLGHRRPGVPGGDPSSARCRTCSGPPRPTPRRSSPRRRAAARRPSSRRRTSSTSRPTCSPTRCAGRPRARPFEPMIEFGAARGVEPRCRADHVPRAGDLGHRGPPPSLAGGRGAVP